MVDTGVPLKITGRSAAATLPPLLQTASRSAGAAGAEDPFLPPGWLRPTGSFDVSPGARGTADGAVSREQPADAGEIVVLELADGSTLITSAGRLRDSLEQARPELVDASGAVLLEKLCADGAAARGLIGEAIGGLVSKVYTLVAGEDSDPIIRDALDELARTTAGGAAPANPALLGTSWAGTKALMGAIENRLGREPDHKPGLYRWQGARELTGLPDDFTRQAPLDTATGKAKPMLVFVHGTGSSTFGSFGELRRGDGAEGSELWAALADRFPGGIFAFEHRTLSESPIDNALQLVRALPAGAQVSLVSHSRGGLVADLLCLRDFDGLIGRFGAAFDAEAGPGGTDFGALVEVLKADLRTAYAEQRAQLVRLAAALSERKPVIDRYVRVASPANGTRLASANFDLFLSGLLSLIGQVPAYLGGPFSAYYSAFKRVVIEIARNRTDPHLVPGIEAMLPDSPMARLLHEAPVQAGLQMAVIAGDIEGGSLLRRLGVLLSDVLLFDDEANDLVVDTAAMLAGVADKAAARVLFDRGADVSHFRYFQNDDTRAALRDWLVRDEPLELDVFAALPGPEKFAAALADAGARNRDAAAAAQPVVVVLPGVMGSNLKAGAVGRVWFELPRIVAGGLGDLGWGRSGVEADDLFARTYGALCQTLAATHRVERFAYDWRQPLDVLAERLGSFLDKLLQDNPGRPIRLLAHSMGGLVVRACIYKRRPVMDELMARDGARLVMLGTPNQGAHSMVENLLGKGDTLRSLVMLDLKHDMQQVLDIVGGFRGALQLLPRPGFVDVFQGQPDGGGLYAFQQAQTWVDLKERVRDRWFGDRRCATPDQPALDAASWLWKQDAQAASGGRPALPAAYESKTVYVCGVAANTPCGVREVKDWRGTVQLKMVGTAHGDGTVTWESGRIGGIGSTYYMGGVQHGDLAATVEHFPALVELLVAGTTARLASAPPATRAVEQPQPVSYDAGPPTLDDAATAERKLMGGSLRNRVPARARRRFEVRVRADDLRFLSMPIMVGHYEQDPIAGPERLIDRELLDGELSQRHSLGLYAGACGTATVVLRMPNAAERARGSLSGAVVTGFGRYDGSLSVQTLTEAVRTGVLRYLLQVVDVLGREDRELPLASLLLGYNSSASLSVNASIEALVTGVMEANARFAESTRLNIRVAKLDIVELYLDTAITAVYALRRLEPRLAERAAAQRSTLVVRRELEQGSGLRQRLFDNRDASYWPRLIITDADRSDDKCPPECYDALPAPAPAVGGGPLVVRPAPRTRLAENLRFLYVGQRARAESVVQQRQPGLVEALVRQQIRNASWQPDFGRMLFQLMMPPDFKDAARQLDRVVLVVDGTTANLPWELMLADDPAHPEAAGQLPLALRTAVVRQLASTRFRRQVRQGTGRRALVIGNPSVEGFAASFVGADGLPLKAEPPDLAGAEAEALAVVALLKGLGYEADRPVIGNTRSASEVLAALYRAPYRLLHVSGHGVYNLLHADGRARSGVVLSDGLLLTAAEIDAMETVPELVFLNCCHLGQIDAGRDGNRLAASVSRELIEIGVRCVVVAGWAVRDDSAQEFGRVFYEQLLRQRRPFGEAVFEARRAVWKSAPDDITWGAFQAYGDAGWRIDPRAGEAAGSESDAYASLDELLDELARIRATLSKRRDLQNEREARLQARAIEDKLGKRCPPGWQALPQLQSALGATWRDLGRYTQARTAFLKAVQAEDKAGRVPIRDIEQLAYIEAQLADALAEAQFAADGAAAEDRADVAPAAGAEGALDLIDLAIRRLRGLDDVVRARIGEAAAPATAGAAGGLPAAGLPVVPPSAERNALLGSAYKRKAAYHARQVLAAEAPEDDGEAASQLREALRLAIEAYRSSEVDPAAGRVLPYNALNRLALESTTLAGPTRASARRTAAAGADAGEAPARSAGQLEQARNAALTMAQHCGRTVAQDYAGDSNVWNAVMLPEAKLVEALLDGSLAATGDRGQGALDTLARAYADSLVNATIKPAELDSLTSHMRLLAYLNLALSRLEGDAGRRRTGECLSELARRIQPHRAAVRSRSRPAPAGSAGEDAADPPDDVSAPSTPSDGGSGVPGAAVPVADADADGLEASAGSGGTVNAPSPRRRPRTVAGRATASGDATVAPPAQPVDAGPAGSATPTTPAPTRKRGTPAKRARKAAK